MIDRARKRAGCAIGTRCAGIFRSLDWAAATAFPCWPCRADVRLLYCVANSTRRAITASPGPTASLIATGADRSLAKTASLRHGFPDAGVRGLCNTLRQVKLRRAHGGVGRRMAVKACEFLSDLATGQISLKPIHKGVSPSRNWSALRPLARSVVPVQPSIPAAQRAPGPNSLHPSKGVGSPPRAPKLQSVCRAVRRHPGAEKQEQQKPGRYSRRLRVS